MEKGAAQAPTSDKALSSLAGGGGEGSCLLEVCLLEASLSRVLLYEPVVRSEDGGNQESRVCQAWGAGRNLVTGMSRFTVKTPEESRTV